MKKFSLPFSILITILFFSHCGEKLEQKGSPQYIKEIQQWHKKREDRLRKDNGWLNLVGLYWLKEGANTFGSAKDNDIVFPSKEPAHIGTFTLNDSVVTININSGVRVLNDSEEVTFMPLKNDLEENTTILQAGTLRWYIIKRGEKYGVRLRNLNAPLIKEFKGIDIFPINEDWKITAKFKPYNPAKKVMIPTILGTTEEDVSPGYLLFKINGKDYKLDALQSSSGFFIIFADQTSGEETYGAGRFIYTDEPDSNGNVMLDFNKAYNPPCAFTKFATCPLPPKQNYLHLKVLAGEKMYGEEHPE